MQRTKLSDPNACEQRQQHAKLAGVHIIQKIRNETRLLFAGQHSHFLFPRLGVIDLDSRESSGEKCCCVFQDTVQNDKHIMHGLRSQLILEKQLLCESSIRPVVMPMGKQPPSFGLMCFRRAVSYLI